jgi:Protein of unknown function (DUF3164)
MEDVTVKTVTVPVAPWSPSQSTPSVGFADTSPVSWGKDNPKPLPAGCVEMNGTVYMTDPRGALVPRALVKPQDQLQDEVVRKIMGYVGALHDQINRFKGHTFEDLNGFQSLLDQVYGGKAGGKKGNVSFISYDGTMKIQVQIAELIEFGPEIQAAKKLIDECLIEWGATSHLVLQALINKVFNVDKEGQINRSDLFSMMRMEVDDARWISAMTAIKDSIRTIGTKQYLRFYIRETSDGAWQAVTIDLASAR